MYQKPNEIDLIRNKAVEAQLETLARTMPVRMRVTGGSDAAAERYQVMFRNGKRDGRFYFLAFNAWERKIMAWSGYYDYMIAGREDSKYDIPEALKDRIDSRFPHAEYRAGKNDSMASTMHAWQGISEEELLKKSASKKSQH